MKRMPFERPTQHYDERIKIIDEQLCELIKQRKEISENNPGFPPLEYISNWANEFQLYEDLLKSLFGILWNQEQFRPFIEPNGFRMNVPVLKSVERDNRFYSVTFIRQYANASIINFNIDWDTSNESSSDRQQHSLFELHIGHQYYCRMTNGGGSTGHLSYNFTVSPPLPDNISGLDLHFKEYEVPLSDKSTKHEIVIHL